MSDLTFRSGGEPSRLPALWHEKTRIAWWPAGYAPTEENVANVWRAFLDKGSVLDRTETARAIRAVA